MPASKSDLERFRPYSRFLARTSWDRRLPPKLDLSDIVQQTLMQALNGVEKF
jgi:hypothetical protein